MWEQVPDLSKDQPSIMHVILNAYFHCCVATMPLIAIYDKATIDIKGETGLK